MSREYLEVMAFYGKSDPNRKNSPLPFVRQHLALYQSSGGIGASGNGDISLE